MSIPLLFLLLLYAIFLAAYFLFSFFLFFHLIRYGLSGTVNLLVFVAYVIVTGIILFFTWSGLRGVDWQMSMFSFVNTLP